MVLSGSVMPLFILMNALRGDLVLEIFCFLWEDH